MNRLLATPVLIIAFAVLGSMPPRASASDFATTLEMLRPAYQADREDFLRRTLGLTVVEEAAFWPLYRKYRADMEPLGDELVKLLLEYRDLYPSVPAERASEMLRRLAALEVKLAQTRGAYLKRAEKALSPVKALRWAQLENRLDLALRAQLASIVPLVSEPAAQP